MLHRLRRVERWLDRTVTGGLAKAFPSPLDVVELESALRAECDARVTSLAGRQVAPNEYSITISPSELHEQDEADLVSLLRSRLDQHIKTQDYSLAGPLALMLQRDAAAVVGLPTIRSAVLSDGVASHDDSPAHILVGARRIGLPDGTFSIGRDDGMALRLDDVGVSRHHCDISRTNGLLTIHDRASTNGTIVNGVRVTKAELSDGDIITIGATQLIVELHP